jgi:hypothetical protein
VVLSQTLQIDQRYKLLSFKRFYKVKRAEQRVRSNDLPVVRYVFLLLLRFAFSFIFVTKNTGEYIHFVYEKFPMFFVFFFAAKKKQKKTKKNKKQKKNLSLILFCFFFSSPDPINMMMQSVWPNISNYATVEAQRFLGAFVKDALHDSKPPAVESVYVRTMTLGKGMCYLYIFFVFHFCEKKFLCLFFSPFSPLSFCTDIAFFWTKGKIPPEFRLLRSHKMGTFKNRFKLDIEVHYRGEFSLTLTTVLRIGAVGQKMSITLRVRKMNVTKS